MVSFGAAECLGTTACTLSGLKVLLGVNLQLRPESNKVSGI